MSFKSFIIASVISTVVFFVLPVGLLLRQYHPKYEMPKDEIPQTVEEYEQYLIGRGDISEENIAHYIRMYKYYSGGDSSVSDSIVACRCMEGYIRGHMYIYTDTLIAFIILLFVVNAINIIYLHECVMCWWWDKEKRNVVIVYSIIVFVLFMISVVPFIVYIHRLESDYGGLLFVSVINCIIYFLALGVMESKGY